MERRETGTGEKHGDDEPAEGGTSAAPRLRGKTGAVVWPANRTWFVGLAAQARKSERLDIDGSQLRRMLIGCRGVHGTSSLPDVEKEVGRANATQRFQIEGNALRR
jgi:hypothetical protein